MRLAPFIATLAEQALRELLSFSAPADGVLTRFFREHAKLGPRERAALAECVYSVLRNRSVYTHIAESGSGPALRRLTLLGLADSAGADALGGLSERERDWLARVQQIDRSALPAALQANLPPWLFDKLVARDGEAVTLRWAAGMNQPAPLDVRVNALKGTREQAMNELLAASISCHPAPYAPFGIRIEGKPPLQNLPLYVNGLIEVQDEGSQLLAQIVGAKRGEMVVDFCAGAGGKTLALGAAMRNTGRLYAFDVNDKRLAKLKPRLARSGLSNVHPARIAHEHDTKIKRLAGKIDRALVDAPCSGLGTLRRNPDIKWRQTPQSVAELNVKQLAILAGAARLIKPGGRLVYATCSMLDEENEAIVASFLNSNGEFGLVPMNQVLAQQKIELEMGDFLRLSPHLHHTDGFFAAVLERNRQGAASSNNS